MSKMGDINLQLQEQLAYLGFETLDEAEASGYTIEYGEGTAKLVREGDHDRN